MKHDPIPQLVDANHVQVQQMIQIGYSEESSIDAVRITGAKSIASALKYLQRLEEIEDNGFVPSRIPPYSKQDTNDSFSIRYNKISICYCVYSSLIC